MKYALLPHVDRQIQAVAAALTSAPPGHPPTFAVSGDPTTGKTTLLLGLREMLRARDRHPVLVSPPTDALEVGALALLEVLGEMTTAGLDTSSARGIIESPGRTWNDKVAATRELLDAHFGRIVLLLDEPQQWRTVQADTPELARHVSDVPRLLASVPCPRVVTGAFPPYAIDRQFVLEPATAADVGTLGVPFWRGLAGAAEDLFNRAPYLRDERTPLELRLLVALTFLEGADTVARWMLREGRRPTRRQIAARLKAALARDTATTPVLETWKKLALERRPFTDHLLDALNVGTLSRDARDLLEVGLLYKDAQGWVLHDMLKGDVVDAWANQSDRGAVHRLLASYHREWFESARNDPEPDHRSVLVHEAESVHHEVQTGDLEALTSARFFFVDQLNIFGRTLSLEYKKYPEAVVVYRRVLEHDAHNDYAHHYLAYNLDVQGLDLLEVEEHYQTSLERETGVALWHAHWIGFLLTHGRTADAQAAWDCARDALNGGSIAVREEIYAQLHAPVARLSLHRAQVDFAQAVLESVPQRLRTRDPGFRALERRLVALRESQHYPAVFPLSIAPSDWWAKGPHLCGWRFQGSPLVRWAAARVEDVDAGRREITLVTASAPLAGAMPNVARMTVAWDRFDGASQDERARELEPGRFVELAVYGDGRHEHLCCRVHPRGREDQDLPPIWPEPDRYLKRTA